MKKLISIIALILTLGCLLASCVELQDGEPGHVQNPEDNNRDEIPEEDVKEELPEDDEKKEETPAHIHEFGEWIVVAPTCTEDGVAYRSCACGEEESVVSNAWGHTDSDWIIDLNPTHESEGTQHKECVVCHIELEKEIIPKKVDTGIISAGAELREAMVNHQNKVSVRYKIVDSADYSKNENRDQLAKKIINEAFVHTGNPKEGDYLKIGNSVLYSHEYQLVDGDQYVLVTYNINYVHTLEEENVLDEFIEKLIIDFNFTENTTDYEKIYTIYSYVCTNVDYDLTMANSSAYDGLIDGSTICQGYALIMYRLLLRVNIDCRFIGGHVYTGEAHAWNIVQLDGLYYNIDATWDEGKTSFRWLLNSPERFIGHTRQSEYNSIAFASKYVMSVSDYNHQHSYAVTTVDPTCDYFGYDDFCCTICAEGYRSNYKDAIGHDFQDGICSICNIKENLADHHIVATGNIGEEISWTIDASGTLTISGSGTIKNYPWYCYSSTIKKLVVNEGVLHIGEHAFNGLTSLEEISLPNSIETIGSFAFASCYNIRDVRLPEGIDAISESLFMDCYNLETVNIPSSVTIIGYGAFERCYKLNNIELPNGVTDIYSFAFAFCTSLTDIKLPNSLINIFGWAFNGCSGLKEIVIPEGVEVIGGSAFWKCSNLEKIKIADTVKELQTSAFKECTSLTSIIIPSGVTSISYELFYGCTSLITVFIHEGIKVIDSTAFTGCTSLTYSEYDNAYYFGSVSNSYLMLIKAKSTSISSCEIHPDTRYISAGAFSNCSRLTSIVIPGNVISVGERAFMNCYSLTAVKICEGVKIINSSAFSYCDNLSSVIICSSIEKLSNSLFNYSDKIIYNEYDNAYYLGNENDPYLILVKAKNKEITSCEIHPETKFIGSEAFKDCSKLTSIVIPESVVSIGLYAFNKCMGLMSVVFEDAEAWYRYASINADSGVELILTDSEQNAMYLNKSYSYSYWFKR